MLCYAMCMPSVCHGILLPSPVIPVLFLGHSHAIIPLYYLSTPTTLHYLHHTTYTTLSTPHYLHHTTYTTLPTQTFPTYLSSYLIFSTISPNPPSYLSTHLPIKPYPLLISPSTSLPYPSCLPPSLPPSLPTSLPTHLPTYLHTYSLNPSKPYLPSRPFSAFSIYPTLPTTTTPPPPPSSPPPSSSHIYFSYNQSFSTGLSFLSRLRYILLGR